MFDPNPNPHPLDRLRFYCYWLNYFEKDEHFITIPAFSRREALQRLREFCYAADIPMTARKECSYLPLIGITKRKYHKELYIWGGRYAEHRGGWFTKDEYRQFNNAKKNNTI